MRFSVSVVDGSTSQVRDVLIDADPDLSLRDLVPHLTGSGNGRIHPSFAARAALWVDGRPVTPGETLREAGIRPGVVVALHEPDGTRPGLPRGVAELRVVSGPGAGRIHRLGLGETVVGCGAPGLSLPDVHLPPDALTLGVATSGAVTVAAAAGLEVRLEQDPVAEPTLWPVGAYLRAGDTVFELTTPWEHDADVSPSEDQLGADFNRPPRLMPPTRDRAFTIPSEPTVPRRTSIPWPMILAPMAMALPAVFFFGPRALIFGLMSPLMALFNWVFSKRGSARTYKEQKAQWDEDLADVTLRIDDAVVTERDDRRGAYADPATLLLTALGPGRRLWERRRVDTDYLAVRIGLADRPSAVTVSDKNRKDINEPEDTRTVCDVPFALSLKEIGVMGLVGEPETVDALSRWLVAQTAILQSPRDVRIVVVTDSSSERRWGWARWLPHCRIDGEAIGALIGTDQESVSRRLGELGQVVGDRMAVLTAPGTKAAVPGPEYVVVLDGARRLRALPGVVSLLRQGPGVGVHLICLDEEESQLPEECRAIVSEGEHGVTVRQTGVETVTEVLADQVEVGWAERIGRALAPVRDTTPSVEDAGLPRSARLLEVIDLTTPTAALVAGRWGSGPEATTEVVIGAGFDGPFRLDLRRDGPHALIAGTTGSGKSELLQTMVASLALANRPDQLTFVLVDYKGGSAFKDCARLPHTVGMVTDLDTHLVGRALTSLGAELRRREHLLAVPGAKDLEDYWALQRSQPELPTIPRLALVIDEFASLKAELPDFVTGLVTIAQRGRSLGIHLVLATQRPTGVVSNDIRANTNLRIALRVTDESESKDVIDAPDSGRIAANAPGRGYARLGHASLLPFQAGRVGGRRPDSGEQEHVVAAPLVWDLPWERVGLPAPVRPTPRGSDTDEGETDLSFLVGAVREATDQLGIPPQRSPWLAALTEVVCVADLVEQGPEPGSEQVSNQVTGFSVPWALQDLPAEQLQAARHFTLGASGHLYVIGGARSGRSTALRTIAAESARRVSAADLHIYALDCGNGALLPLSTLPHTGAVVQRTETVRAGRLLGRLSEEVQRRQALLGQAGYADLDEQRTAATASERLPYILFMVDRWEGFVSDLADVDLGKLNEAVLQLLREGASVGVHVILSGDRSLLSGRIASLVEDKLLLRLPDRSDYSSGGLRPKDVPESMAPGRGLWGESGIEAQIAVLSRDVSGSGQSAAIREIAAVCTERDRDVPDPLLPFTLGVLPSEVSATTVLDRIDADPLRPLRIPVALGGDDLEVITLDISAAPAVFVGQPRTGRTAALQFVAAHAARAGRTVLGFTPRENRLSAQLGPQAVVGTDLEPESIVARLRDLQAGSLILVDDAESLREGPLAPVMMAVVKQARDKEFGVVIAGGISDLAGGFSGWIFEARKGRTGLVLSPADSLNGDIFGGRVARSSLLARPHPGRAVVFDGTGDQVLGQVPYVTPTD